MDVLISVMIDVAVCVWRNGYRESVVFRVMFLVTTCAEIGNLC